MSSNAGTTKRIAMWSGPRNISTAMMRSWENRPDCTVVDEPLYAYYLNRTGDQHPGYEAVLQSQSSDYDQVTWQLANDQCNHAIQYQKHMTHHWFDGLPLHWAKHLTHVFLIRDPHEIVASYAAVRGNCTLQDIGVVQQAKLFNLLSELSDVPIVVVDSNEVLKDPRSVLSTLCDQLGIEFYEQMLNWPAGKRDTDGVWAPYWYKSVEASTGFKAYSPSSYQLTPTLQKVVDAAMPYYEAMAERALVALK